MIEFSPGFPVISNTITESKGYAFPRLLRSEIAEKPLSIKVHILSKNRCDAMETASNLVLALNKKVEIYGPDKLYYSAVLSAAPSFNRVSIGYMEITFAFKAVAHGALQTIKIPRNNYPLHYPGTAPAGYRIEFTTPSALSNFTVNGITLTNIPNGAEIVIDGIEKRVTQNGINKFAETDLIDFPRFDPRSPDTVVTMSQYIPVTIKFYPTYM